MSINYENLKKALVEGAEKYRKNCFSGMNKVSFFHGKEGKNRSLKIEEYVKQIGTNQLAILMLANAVMNNPQGTTLQEYVCDAIIAGKVFAQGEFEAKQTYFWGKRLEFAASSSGAGGSPGLAKRGAVQALLGEALHNRRDLFVDTAQRIGAICEELNDVKKDAATISMNPFAQEMSALNSGNR